MLNIPVERIPNDRKFKELVIFIALQCQDDPWFGATKLNKLLFYSDFIAYSKFGRAITWHTYQRLDNGPAPRRMLPMLSELEREGSIVRVERDRFGKTQKTAIARREANLEGFSGEEIGLVASLIKQCWGKSARQISDLSHSFIGWKIAGSNEDIPYEMALVRPERPTAADLAKFETLGQTLNTMAEECNRGRQV
jgi:hypothetical protein